jgi:hypothetical protein
MKSGHERGASLSDVVVRAEQQRDLVFGEIVSGKSASIVIELRVHTAELYLHPVKTTITCHSLHRKEVKGIKNVKVHLRIQSEHHGADMKPRCLLVDPLAEEERNFTPTIRDIRPDVTVEYRGAVEVELFTGEKDAQNIPEELAFLKSFL